MDVRLVKVNKTYRLSLTTNKGTIQVSDGGCGWVKRTNQTISVCKQ